MLRAVLLAAGTSGLLLLGGACSNEPSASETQQPAAAQEQQIEATAAAGTGGALIPIDSDNVAMAGYDDRTRVMTVMFHSARLYEYYDVPPALWEAFVAAQPDPWSLVGYPQLVQGGYSYREITP